jgi:hypothetical protein
MLLKLESLIDLISNWRTMFSTSEPRRRGFMYLMIGKYVDPCQQNVAISPSQTGPIILCQQHCLSIRHLVRVTRSFAESYIRYAKRVEGF